MKGRAKALLPLQHHTFVDEILSHILPLPFEEIILVTGHESHLVRAHFAGKITDPRVKISNNSLFITGIFRSIKSGIKGLSKPADAVMLMLCDQPLVAGETYRALFDAFTNMPEKILLHTDDQGTSGYPQIMGSNFFQEILTHIPSAEERDQDCHHFFQRLKISDPEKIKEVAIPTSFFKIQDFNTEEDLISMQES